MATTHHAVHEITVAAPASRVYELVADVAAWPAVFPPTVHAEVVGRDGQEERIRIWATANGEVKKWTSRRRLDPEALRIHFRQEVSQHPVAAMGGTWVIRPVGDGLTAITLEHDYQAVSDAHVAWIEEAVDRNSQAELSALKGRAEHARSDELTMSFEDTVEVSGKARDLYAFIDEAEHWPDRLPHVARVELTEPAPGVQRLAMDTLAPDGSTHTTESIRLVFPTGRIVYKQLRLPKLLTVHTGEWRFADTETGSTVTSRHTVVLNPDAIAPVLGPAAGIADAREYVRDALSHNSATTMRHAKDHAERNL
ncbi:aromatase/cyclase [Nonomuraea sp. NPDC050451]|uniref:aromatase/cyclase n=1 Tax=Nonomuraea sp. NPDC050451 TaxID=3364364 RepID=UPI0037BD1CF5